MRGFIERFEEREKWHNNNNNHNNSNSNNKKNNKTTKVSRFLLDSARKVIDV